MDATERLKLRRKMKIRLSRYGRIDYHGWGPRLLSEMEDAHEDVRELIKKEEASPEEGD